MPRTTPLRVLIVAQNASTKFGGEAILPWHYFRLLRKRGVDVRLVVHERTRDELLALLPDEASRMRFVPDLTAQQVMFRVGQYLPGRINENTIGFLTHAITALMQRNLVRDLVTKHRIDVIHEPIPVSPKQPSFMFGLGAPVIIGPMNGGMDFPPAFAGSASLAERAFMGVGRELAHVVNQLIPGKRDAAILLTANERTRKALPRSASQHVIQLVENGVDMGLFHAREQAARTGETIRFVFMGRLVDWKRVDILLEACSKLQGENFTLEILGDGPLRGELESYAQGLGIAERVIFHGMQPQARCSQVLSECDALVLPSLRECGGAVVLEAMACGLPVIATRWGGPADYLDERSGILVDPTGHGSFVAGLIDAMRRMITSPELRARLGEAGKRRVQEEFDWERKIDRILDIYEQAVKPEAQPGAKEAPPNGRSRAHFLR
jgi:glycosyltransferase involved in cell wall biosynthesis